MPARFRFRAHCRIPDVLVLGDEGTCYWVGLEYTSTVFTSYRITSILIIRIPAVNGDEKAFVLL